MVAPLHFVWRDLPPLTAQQRFENAEWTSALAGDAGEELRDHVRRHGHLKAGPVEQLLLELKARWEGMSYRERRPYEDAVKEHATRRAAEEASRFDGGISNVSLLNALLLRSPGVRMLSLKDAPWSDREWRETPELHPGNLLRRIGAAFTELRVVHLGRAAVDAADIHALLAGCRQLAQLNMDEVDLAEDPDGAAALFGKDMEPHNALRYVSLPYLRNHLLSVVFRLLRRCPQLFEINAWKQCARTEDDVYWLQDVARAAAKRGLRRFTHHKVVDRGRMYGYDSTDDEGHYIGDGNVIKYLPPRADDDSEDEYGLWSSDEE